MWGRMFDSLKSKRSIADIFKDMVSNIQEIVRCEIRLVKADVKQEAMRYLPFVRLVSAGASFGLFGVGFLLLSAVYALALVMPIWAAAALIGLVLSIASVVMINAGLGHWRQLSSVQKVTNEAIKEQTAWSNHPAR